ncbi:DNA adenine methylase [Pedobacter cryoconitis]|uniref:Site-specific DNA-methyltransferase (adenine-specific) n=2 Tax=Pedobacter cryoconitis TaxID=188932 RepID=A0A327RV13_9SPHI|nr:DNA adenine methylase [Pedobacter cryoconitis]
MPFLRWTGSKRWFTKSYINEFLPSSFNNYHEPFLGAGSVYFYLKGLDLTSGIDFHLSDSNKELINAYIQIRDNPEEVISYLKNFINSENQYYHIRQLKPRKEEKKAARFIYLNRTSFNGIYRVNSQGLYNVPYGHREKVDVVTEKLLLEVSRNLQGASFTSQSFEQTITNVKKGDLVFLDPPYTVAHENNGFIEYNQHLFSWTDQEKLRDYVKELIKKEAFFILTNASHNSILELYSGIGEIKKLSRLSQVGGRNKTRGSYNELIITNTTI